MHGSGQGIDTHTHTHYLLMKLLSGHLTRVSLSTVAEVVSLVVGWWRPAGSLAATESNVYRIAPPTPPQAGPSCQPSPWESST